MAPEFFHLPDLPAAGYSTQREKALTDSIMMFCRDIERDRVRLLTIVVQGIETWRKIAESVWNGFRIDRELTDEIFHYFELQASRPTRQRQLLAAAQNPAVWRDLMRREMPHIERAREEMRLLQKWHP